MTRQSDDYGKCPFCGKHDAERLEVSSPAPVYVCPEAPKDGFFIVDRSYTESFTQMGRSVVPVERPDAT